MRKKMMAFLIVLAFFIAPAGTALGAGMGQEAALTGWLSVVWGDGSDGSAESGPLFFLATDDGGPGMALSISPQALEAAGGIAAIDRQQVRIYGARQSAGSGESFQVEKIELLSPQSQALRSGVLGKQPWVNILCRFKDSTGVTPHPVAWFSTLFGNAYPGLDHYWREASYNNINLNGTTTAGWFNLPKKRSEYIPGGQLDLGLAVRDCTAAAEAAVYFPEFIGINMMFNDDLDGYAWGGGWCLSLDGVNRCWNMTWLPPWGYENQSPLAHEMGHGFGLPHSSGPYDATYDSKWDVMSNTWDCFTRDPNYGCIAQHTITYHKDLLGWIPASRQYVHTASSLARTIHLTNLANPSPADGDYQMVKMPLPGGQFYTIEARFFTGYDGVARIPGEAVVIHKVNSADSRPARVVDASNNKDPNDAGAMWLPGEVFSDSQNNITVKIVSKTATGFEVAIGGQSKRSFTAQGSYDGQVTESRRNSNKGGKANASSAMIMVGDDAANRRVCAIFSFNTASLPDTIQIQAAQFVLHRIALTGAPTRLGNLWVDAQKGYFHTSPKLQPADFQAAAAAENVTRLTAKNTTYQAAIPAAYINLSGLTQFRVCYNDDNRNSRADYLTFHSGNSANTALRPKLNITYSP